MIDILDLSSFGSILEISTPSIKISPLVGLKIPVISFKIELFPAPDFPTKATNWPEGIEKVISSNIFLSPFTNDTFSKLISPWKFIFLFIYFKPLVTGNGLCTMNNSCTLSALASITWKLPATLLNLRSGSKIKAIAVKKAIKSPIDFSPETICAPPKIITPKKPIPAIKSINAGVEATPPSIFNLIFLTFSNNFLKELSRYVWREYNFKIDIPWKISSKEILKSASIFLFSPDILRIHFCNKKIGITSIGAPIKAITVHFQSTYKATATNETRAIPSFTKVIKIVPAELVINLVSTLILSINVPGEVLS